MASKKIVSTLGGVQMMAKRLQYGGGFPQQNRMIKDKRWTLDHATKYSYQAAKVKLLDKAQIAKALINPNKLTQDYDDKILSLGYEYNFKPGDIFEWCNTNSKWIIYLQDLDELAYFKGKIRRCRYQVSWFDENNEIQTTYMAVRGPVETAINFIQKNQISVDNPNHSLNILMPKNEATLKYFRRYAKFYLQGIDEGDKNTCWRVEAVDSISMPGVLSITADEYFSNEFKDDIDNKLVDGLLVKPVTYISEDKFISGDGFIKPKTTHSYKYLGKEAPTWSIDAKYPLEYSTNGKTLTLKWTKAYSGQFIIVCNGHEKTVVVESLI